MGEVETKVQTVPQGNWIIRDRGGKTSKHPVVLPGGGRSKYFDEHFRRGRQDIQ